MSVFNSLFFLYADPGAGALLLQMLMAVLFGGMFFFRRIKDKILSIFGKNSVGNVEISSEEAGSSDTPETAQK